MLDIDLRGETVYPLADALRARGVPFVFLTGYGQPVIAEAWRGAPRVEKPFEAPALLDVLGRLVAGGPVSPDHEARHSGDPSKTVRDTWATIKRQRDLIMEARIRCAATGSGLRLPPEQG